LYLTDIFWYLSSGGGGGGGIEVAFASGIEGHRKHGGKTYSFQTPAFIA
jgi:hypothetical protein